MMRNKVAATVLLALLITGAARAEKTVFYDQITGCEIWRITNDAEAFYTHTYVEIPSIDATGRWVAFHRRAERVYVADLASGAVRDLGSGGSPLWHPSEPTLFFWRQGTEMRTDPTTGRTEVAVEADAAIRGTSTDGRHGVFVADNAIWRVALKPGSKPSLVLRAPPGIEFRGHMRYNPTQPWIFIIAKRIGQRLNGPCFVVRDDGSQARRFDWFGEYIGHLCWAADGSGMLRANTPWPVFKPFPLRADTPWETLSATQFWPNHIGCCGRDGRLVATDRDNQDLYITDTLTRHSTRLCVASGFSVPYTKDGDPHAHGSPDGTKLQFDSCYDLRDRGLTTLAQPLSATADAIEVASTTRFPNRGVVMIGRYRDPEFVRYERKDATHFLACTRGFVPPLCKSLVSSVRVTARSHAAGTLVSDYFGRFRALGVRRGPQIYVAVVRDPAPPRALAARRGAEGVELTWEPPELHHEIAGCRVERSSESGRGFAPIAKCVASPVFTDKDAGAPGPHFYRVISLERSGLESVPSVEAVVTEPAADAPPRRLLIEAEACSFVGQGGPDFSTACYGRQYVASKSSWLAAPFRLTEGAKCAVWLRVRTPDQPCRLDLWMVRGNLREPVAVQSPHRFTWQRLASASGQPLLIPAAKGENTITLCRRDAPYDLDRLCITDDLGFVPPDDKAPITNDRTWQLPADPVVPSRLVEIQTMPRPGAEVLIPPKQTGHFSLRLTHRQIGVLSASITVGATPPGLTLRPREVSLHVKANEWSRVRFDATPIQAGARGDVHLLVRARDWEQQCVIPVRAVAEPFTLLQVEAERACALPQSAKVVASAQASGGKYVELTDGPIEFELDLPKDTQYTLWVRQFAPLEGFGYFADANGEFFRVIGKWEDVLGRWCWLTSPRVPRHRWPAGKLRLKLKRRGHLFRRVDSIVVTDNPDYEPGW